MKIDAIKTQVTEVFLETDSLSVVVSTWGTGEGVNIMVHNKNPGSMLMAGTLRWNEADALVAALYPARTS